MIKGFKSLPADANIALINVKLIPLLHPICVKNNKTTRSIITHIKNHSLDMSFIKKRKLDKLESVDEHCVGEEEADDTDQHSAGEEVLRHQFLPNPTNTAFFECVNC